MFPKTFRLVVLATGEEAVTATDKAEGRGANAEDLVARHKMAKRMVARKDFMVLGNSGL